MNITASEKEKKNSNNEEGHHGEGSIAKRI
jgi:hypothetical protein